MVLLDQFPVLTSMLTTALLAAFCGGVVGLERELRDKPAGLKTNALICLGAAMYVYFGELSEPAAEVELRSHGSRHESRVPIIGTTTLGYGPYLYNLDVTRAVQQFFFSC